jgi:hypothetical protein
MANLYIKQKQLIINILTTLQTKLTNTDLFNYCEYIINIFNSTKHNTRDSLYNIFYNNPICKKINRYNAPEFMITFINTLTHTSEFNDLQYNIIYFEYIKYIALISINPTDTSVYHHYELLDMFHELYSCFFIYEEKQIIEINFTKFKFFLNILGDQHSKFIINYTNKKYTVKPYIK